MPRRILLLLAAGALMAPAGAGARSYEAVARLAECDVEARRATFEGDMRAIPGARRLQMRFTLQVRDADGAEWARVAAPTFGAWVGATPGRARFVYAKQVDNLAPGADYRALVRFRWRSAQGEVVARALRVTRPCHQPEDRPDLRPVRVEVGPGSTPETRTYSVVVANRGLSGAAPFAVALEVDGRRLPAGLVGGLAAFERSVVAFEGPPCSPGSRLVAVADVTAAVDEADEGDNVLSVPCPAALGSRR